jgi:DNA mismatch endonuclease (patch repair protein)
MPCGRYYGTSTSPVGRYRYFSSQKAHKAVYLIRAKPIGSICRVLINPGWTPPEGSWASSSEARNKMLANKSRDTRPELLVRSLVHRRGLRYRISARPLPGLRRTADLVFRPTRTAVFIDGCYWHGCPNHYTEPKTNTDYWRAKITGNRQRDRQTDELLSKAGWLVLRFWEHEDPNEIAEAIATAVEGRRQEAIEHPHYSRYQNGFTSP